MEQKKCTLITITTQVHRTVILMMIIIIIIMNFKKRWRWYLAYLNLLHIQCCFTCVEKKYIRASIKESPGVKSGNERIKMIKGEEERLLPERIRICTYKSCCPSGSFLCGGQCLEKKKFWRATLWQKKFFWSWKNTISFLFQPNQSWSN